jgi:hypothetical protein
VTADRLNLVEPQDVGGIGSVTAELARNTQSANTEAAANNNAPFLVRADRRSTRPSVHVVEDQPRKSISFHADHAAHLFPRMEARGPDENASHLTSFGEHHLSAVLRLHKGSPRLRGGLSAIAAE